MVFHYSSNTICINVLSDSGIRVGTFRTKILNQLIAHVESLGIQNEGMISS